MALLDSTSKASFRNGSASPKTLPHFRYSPGKRTTLTCLHMLSLSYSEVCLGFSDADKKTERERETVTEVRNAMRESSLAGRCHSPRRDDELACRTVATACLNGPHSRTLLLALGHAARRQSAAADRKQPNSVPQLGHTPAWGTWRNSGMCMACPVLDDEKTFRQRIVNLRLGWSYFCRTSVVLLSYFWQDQWKLSFSLGLLSTTPSPALPNHLALVGLAAAMPQHIGSRAAQAQ